MVTRYPSEPLVLQEVRIKRSGHAALTFQPYWVKGVDHDVLHGNTRALCDHVTQFVCILHTDGKKVCRNDNDRLTVKRDGKRV